MSKLPFAAALLFVGLFVIAQSSAQVATTVEDFGAPVPAAGNVAVHCELNPTAPDAVSPDRAACDAPIVFVIEAIDMLATQVAVRCISKLNTSLPGYTKNWKVLGSLATGNPIAVAIALGAAAEGDLRECGLEGIIAGLPASAQVRNDLQKILDAVRNTENYLSLQSRMRKVMSLADQAIDPGTLVQDVGDAYMNRREVEGLGKEISSLGKDLAKGFKGAAEDVTVLEGGVEALSRLVETARSALQDQEAIAEEFRDSVHADVADCRVEDADRSIVRAQEAARLSLLQSRQAIANARELRVCIVERIQATLGGVTDWRRTVHANPRKDLVLQEQEFDRLAVEIDAFERQSTRRSVLLGNIGRQCRIIHDQAMGITRDIEQYDQIIRSIEDSLSDPALCSVDDLRGRIVNLKSFEEKQCSWSLPRKSWGVTMSEMFENRSLTRQRQLQVDRQLFEALETDAVAAIDAGAYDRAAQILDSMDGMTRSPCLDGSVVASLRNRLHQPGGQGEDLAAYLGNWTYSYWDPIKKGWWLAATLHFATTGSVQIDTGSTTYVGQFDGKEFNGHWMSKASSHFYACDKPRNGFTGWGEFKWNVVDDLRNYNWQVVEVRDLPKNYLQSKAGTKQAAGYWNYCGLEGTRGKGPRWWWGPYETILTFSEN